jgi:hypothetical protein
MTSDQGRLDPLDYWRLCDELSIIQGALLIVGCDPGPMQDYVERWDGEKRPKGYEAAKTALSNGLRNETIEGVLEQIAETDINGNEIGYIEGSIHLQRSRVFVASLKTFLAKRGFNHGFFATVLLPEPSYLDPASSNYAPKLAAAVGAWQAVTSDEAALKAKTPKKALEVWLRKHADEFGLTKDDGNPNEQGIEEIAKIANWNPKGGAPRTPNDNPPTPREHQDSRQLSGHPASPKFPVSH